MRKRNFCLCIRLTENERERVKLMQKRTNLNMRDFVLKCMSEKPIYVKPYGAEIVTQLKAIGNNLNQLTRKVNSGEIFDCRCQLTGIRNDIEELMKRWQ